MSDSAELAASLDGLVGAVTRERAALAALRGDIVTNDLLALSHLRRHGSLSPGALSRLLLLTPGGTTAVIHRLLGAGLVVRFAGPANHRDVRLSTTCDGRALGAIPVDSDVLEGEPSDMVSLIDAIATSAAPRPGVRRRLTSSLDRERRVGALPRLRTTLVTRPLRS